MDIQIPDFIEFNTKTTVPFLKMLRLILVCFTQLWFLVITGTSNAVNLTDGLDGLLAGLLAIAFAVFSAITYITEELIIPII